MESSMETCKTGVTILLEHLKSFDGIIQAFKAQVIAVVRTPLNCLASKKSLACSIFVVTMQLFRFLLQLPGYTYCYYSVIILCVDLLTVIIYVEEKYYFSK